MGRFRRGLILLFLLILPISCRELSFTAKENPIKKLQLTIKLVEDLQLYYFSQILVAGDHFKIRVNDYLPLNSIFPFHITGTEGNYKGSGGEDINYDYSNCTTQGECKASFKVEYPGNSEIKERNIVFYFKKYVTNATNKYIIKSIFDDQRLKSGEKRIVKLKTGLEGFLIVKNIFPPLSPYKEEELKVYFSMITAGDNGIWYPEETTEIVGTIVSASGKIWKRKYEKSKELFTLMGEYSVTITYGKGAVYWSSKKDFMVPGISDEISSSLQKRYFGFTFIPQNSSPVLKREFWYSVTDSVKWVDTIVYNDSTMDRIICGMKNGEMNIKYGGYEGKLSVVNTFQEVKFSGAMYGKDGVYDIDITSPLGILWQVEYWWDDYHSKEVSPDEEGELSYYFLYNGNGSVTLYQGNRTSASTIYKYDFWSQKIK